MLMSGLISRPYREIFGLHARHHLHQVLAGQQIDLMFVADGIGFRPFRRVLRVLFERHDVHGGERRIEERDLSGLPGIRVVIHNFELGESWQENRYPEPDYNSLGRARVLHVYRDRGGREDPATVPEDCGRRPVRGPRLLPV